MMLWQSQQEEKGKLYWNKCLDNEKVISYWNLREKDDFIKYSDDIELIFVELPKFKKAEAIDLKKPSI